MSAKLIPKCDALIPKCDAPIPKCDALIPICEDQRLVNPSPSNTKIDITLSIYPSGSNKPSSSFKDLQMNFKPPGMSSEKVTFSKIPPLGPSSDIAINKPSFPPGEFPPLKPYTQPSLQPLGQPSVNALGQPSVNALGQPLGQSPGNKTPYIQPQFQPPLQVVGQGPNLGPGQGQVQGPNLGPGQGQVQGPNLGPGQGQVQGPNLGPGPGQVQGPGFLKKLSNMRPKAVTTPIPTADASLKGDILSGLGDAMGLASAIAIGGKNRKTRKRIK
jgi:hypothetical protein